MAAIELDGLTKRYRGITAVDDLTLALPPGRVTGLVGANGAGKTTTIRMILGLTRPTAGRATIDGQVYAAITDPTRSVGAMVDPNVFHPNRSGRNSLRVIARAAGIPEHRVDHVLDQVDLGAQARRRTGGYSTGMRQRLALAAALLGDPPTLVLDEPGNGLDPQGIHWLRHLKVRTTRAAYVATAVSIAFAALIPSLACTDPVEYGVAPLTAASLADLMRAPAQVTGGAALLLGILAAASEHSHATILTTRLVQPNPVRVLAAKILAMAVVGAALGATAEAVAAAVGAIGLAANGVALEFLSHEIPSITATVILLVTGYAVLGTAIGTLLRNTTAAVGGTLIWAFAIENVLPVVAGNPTLADWMPDNAAQNILAPPQTTGPTPAVSTAVLLGTTALLITLATTADQRRDP